MYEGAWFNDLRQGKGRQEYPNKDVYEGTWELNLVSSGSTIGIPQCIGTAHAKYILCHKHSGLRFYLCLVL